MNFRRLRSSLIFSIIGSSFACMEAGELRGIIKDRVTGEPIIGATVFAAPGNYGAVTDVDGIYSLVQPQGKYDITVRCIGYCDMIPV